MCDVAELLHAPMAFHLLSGGLQEVAGPSHLVWPGFASARVLPTMGRGRLHQGRSRGIFVAAVICDALRWTGHVTQGMISSVLTVWKEGRSRKGIMDGPKFIAVDNHEAVVGWLAPRHRVFPGGAANVYSRFLIRSHPRRSGRGYTAGA